MSYILKKITKLLVVIWRTIFPLPQPPPRSFEDFSTVERLPPEVLVCIGKHLPTSSVALLALSSKTLLEKLGSKHFKGLRQKHLTKDSWEVDGRSLTDDEQAREDFLSLLERDIKDRVFCHFCQTIHRVDKSYTKPYPIDQCIPTSKAHIRAYQCENNYKFHCAHMVGKSHRSGLTKSIQRETQFGKWFTSRYDSRQRVINGRLYQRRQRWVLLYSGIEPELPGLLTSWSVCYHESVDNERLGPDSGNEFAAYLWSRINDHQQARSASEETGLAPTEVRQCRCCSTDYQVDVKDFRDWGFVVVITTWKHLGQALTPFDKEWWSHFSPRGERRSDLALGSIKKAFEGGDDFDFNAALTEKAANRLAAGKYIGGYRENIVADNQFLWW